MARLSVRYVDIVVNIFEVYLVPSDTVVSDNILTTEVRELAGGRSLLEHILCHIDSMGRLSVRYVDIDVNIFEVSIVQ